MAKNYQAVEQLEGDGAKYEQRPSGAHHTPRDFQRQ